MRLTVLVDNNTLIDRYFLAEPGLSLHLASQGRNILFDAGYSDALLRNSVTLGLDLADLDAIALSHSHLDHTWGLVPLFRRFTETAIEGGGLPRPDLVAHPDIFKSREAGPCPEIGSLVSEETTARFCALKLSTEPVWLTDELVFLGEIPRVTDFECLEPVGRVRDKDGINDCFVTEDTALACKTDKGLVVITGCSHAGICNIISHAQKVCGEKHVHDIIGGFHLLDPPEAQLRGTLDYLAALAPDRVHACHCTDLRSKIALATVVNVREVGVGLVLEY